ncbi:MAG: DNA-processing protein DprA [Patescibacteria group bacterium]
MSNTLLLQAGNKTAEKLLKNGRETAPEEAKYWLAFSQINKIGPVKFRKILRYFNNLKNAWQADTASFIKSGIEEKLAQEIIILRSQINPDEEWEKLAKEKVNFVTITDESYPPLLKEIYDAPPILYFRGSLEPLYNFCLGVVGTRKFSPYGRQAAKEIVSDLSRQGITIVSGLALGIDAIAHEACLQAGGLTAAVLGSGLDWQNIYPSQNRYLANKIIESDGAILSEYPIGTMPAKFTFPMRNRIISGLSLGTLVIEAPESSGALITAKHALEQNREVFALPGSIYSVNSQGTNNLIKQGAKMVTKADDILEEFNLRQIAGFTKEKKIVPESQEEEMIIKILSQEPTHIDKIANESKLKINALASLLTMMEIKGMIKDAGGKNYILIK